MNKFEQLKFKALQTQLEKCSKLLDDAGVPEWVENSDNKNVPANSVSERLKWFLSRRKNVKESEIDKKLQKEMKLLMEQVEEYEQKTKM